MAAIAGITKNTLWSAWKEVRAQLKRAPRRDVLDYLEYDVNPDVWIARLLKRIKESEYSPERPARCTVAKSNGFDRVITIPAVPDLVLYRAIVDAIYKKAKKKDVKHAYFSQSALSKVVTAAEKAALQKIADGNEADDAGYPTTKGILLEWLKYDQYRKLLIFERIFQFIVVTDITNFFDSVLYSKVEESLYELKVPAPMIGLLFHLLESFSLRDGMTPSQRIGLPVDPCECSRVLAHMMLLPHDLRMVNLVGESAYVRWMDDQNIGVSSKADGLRALLEVGTSLRSLHLTPNSSKSKVLSLNQAKKHFHFRANARLDDLEKLPFGTRDERAHLRGQIDSAWKSAVRGEGVGEWEKVLKRFYRNAARAKSKIFIDRAHDDILKMPGLTDRIVDYVRYSSSAKQFVSFVLDVLDDDEQIYADVSYRLVDGLLKVSPPPTVRKRLLELGQSLLDKDSGLAFAGIEEVRALAPLLILRYGDGRHLRGLAGKLKSSAESLPQSITRALCAVVGGSELAGYEVVRSTASKLLRNHLSEFVKLIDRVREFEDVPGRFKTRLSLAKDSITGASYLDMRSILAARILGLSEAASVHNWLDQTKKNHKNAGLTDFELSLLDRLWPKATHGKRVKSA